MLVHTAHEQWASPDFFVHLAAVREFALHPTDPGNPILTGDDPDPYLSPYTWIVSQPVRLWGVDPVRALAVAGIANLLLLLFAFRRFVAAMSPQAWAPVLTLVFTLVGWGLPTWRWSGLLNLNSLGFGLPYGATFATAVALLVLAQSELFLRGGSRWSLAVAGIGTPLVMLTHPMTAMWAAAVGLAIVVAKLDRRHLRRCVELVLVALGGLAATLAWPFYPVFELPGGVEEHAAPNVYRNFFQRTFLGLIGVQALVLRFRARRRDPLLIAAALTGSMCLIGWLIHAPILGRALPGLMLTLHIALAEQLASLLTGRSRLAFRLAAATAIVVIAIVGLAGTAPGLARSVPRSLLPSRMADDPRLGSLVEPYRVLSDRVDRDDVVVAYPNLSVGTAAMGGHVIAPHVPAAFVEDRKRRRSIEETILHSTDPDQRAAAMRAHQVEWLVVPPGRYEEHLRALAEAGIPASLEIRTQTLALIRVWPEGKVLPPGNGGRVPAGAHSD